jgi:hypothetical protein
MMKLLSIAVARLKEEEGKQNWNIHAMKLLLLHLLHLLHLLLLFLLPS